MIIRFSSRLTAAAALAVASALVFPPSASASVEAAMGRGASVSEVAVVGRALPSRDLGPCWAQAGRVVGGFFGSIGVTIVSPGWSVAAWAAYLGQIAQEKRTSTGDFAC
ncbi:MULTISPECIES: hypothetical protein [Microbacterium]|uniref:Uncharacterized protein n=1 Tax=Microbacterium sufflavum TaxID=2851649 RepID=A0ABY4IIV0_9MICO|nr:MULTISPECIES: hypothetical protein [Microbacterium]UPL12690.1 hypothetical protein KV394_16985 [Microbacterium sufflavum]